MEKEKIKKFDKEQLEILLNDLQDIDKFTGFKDGAFKYELGKYQASLLVSCIKKQQEIIDKIFTRITLWKMEDITMETAKVLDDLLSMFKEV